MRLRTKRAVGFCTGTVIAAVAALWAALLTVNAVLGLSAMSDDYEASASNLETMFRWLLQ